MLWNRRRFESDLEEEMQDHLRRKAADSGSEEARRSFGNVTALKERSRDVWTWTLLEQFLQDVRYGMRALAANKVFTLMAVVSLALGIGANTAIYSFLDTIMIRSLPVRNPEQLAILNWRAKANPPVVRSHWGSDYDEPGGGTVSPNHPYPAFEFLRAQNTALAPLFGFVHGSRFNVTVDGQAEVAEGHYVTGEYFQGLGVPAALGRLVSPEDDRSGAPAVAVLAFEYWNSRFAGDAGVVGKAIQINGKPFTIVGVSAPEFYGVVPDSKPAVFVPMSNIQDIDDKPNWPAAMKDGKFYWIELMGRLKPGVTLAGARAQLVPLYHNFVKSTATTDRERANLPSLSLEEGGSGLDSLRRQYSKPLLVMMGMVGLILAIACANVANLLLARAAGRRREMAVRLSMGAGRWRVVRQLLTESVLLALISAAAGIGVAAAGIRVLSTLLANGQPLTFHPQIDWRVLSFTVLVALGTGILFGLAPALRATQVDVTPALKETRASEPRGRRRLGVRFGLSHVLVVTQIAMSLVLVVAAGLFVQTLANLHAVNLGFNAENILVFELEPGKAGYKDAAVKRFYEGIQTRLQSLPGVRGATSTDMPLVSNWGNGQSITVPGIPKPPEGQRGPSTNFTQVGTDFFETLELPIVLGRPLDKRDVEGSQPVAVVNQVFADKYFPGQNPLGRHFTFGIRDGVDVEIVGIAKTARYNSLKRQIGPVTYLPWLQSTKRLIPRQMFFEVRTAGDPMALANAVRQVVREASPLVPVTELRTQKGVIEKTIVQERTFAQLCACFGGLAMLMACVGLYGTMAYAVARRTGEIGIRMALGAERGRIVWMVLREVLWLSGVGVALGLATAYQASAAVQSFLFGLKPHDPWALACAVALLAGCGLVAGFVPARRASRIDPMVALRHE
jgi:predicted permease